MVSFTAVLQKFDKKGEKTGWTYLEIPAEMAQKIKENTRVSFRVKGKIDEFPIKLVALIPMGEGDFILPINAQMRKGIRKTEGASVLLSLEEDQDELAISSELLICLEDEPVASKAFHAMPKSHQFYYSKWIESAKTIETKSKRISMTVQSLAMGMDYGQMLRYFRDLGK
ncbi:YdeI/OmpD-associated family protein [Arcicella rigui]|uniref:YdeI/OmpD-associated family protein n=1 Tax=Arcicella rigui TaxID=797020 RepID=A0ABU5QI02_9BACT|nr:YdeI/OmpD-associated family protein [Arcicella rigui]MEA5141909.1 YdeI/OmpD-associated family protein [Arcicella rigui]